RPAGGASIAATLLGAALALGCVYALLAGPRAHAMDPTRHAYEATVWLLTGWTVAHVLVGTLMQLYCVARRVTGRMDAVHDIDIHNVTLFWHFVAITVVVTVATIAGFPLMA